MSKNYFKNWYAKPENRASLAARRKERYATDPNYKQRVLKATESYRARTQPKDKPPIGYDWSLKEACDFIGISHQTFRSWRSKHYFPEPKYFKSRLIFTQNQDVLLRWELKTTGRSMKFLQLIASIRPALKNRRR